jgi:hypothetical protein
VDPSPGWRVRRSEHSCRQADLPGTHYNGPLAGPQAVAVRGRQRAGQRSPPLPVASGLPAGNGRAGRRSAGRPVSRVLCRPSPPTPLPPRGEGLGVRGRRSFLLAAGCPAAPATYPRVVTGRTSPAPLFGLAPGGVCRASLSPGCWCALTQSLRQLCRPLLSGVHPCKGRQSQRRLAPFHPYLSPAEAGPSAVCFLLHFPCPSPQTAPPGEDG